MFQSNGSIYADRQQKSTGTGMSRVNSELHITSSQTVVHHEGSSDKQNQGNGNGSNVELRRKFENHLRHCPPNEQLSWDWNSPDQVEVKGLTNAELHPFILQMKEEGRKVEFIRTTTIKIS